jgi:phenylpyruvate tautomerase PptA (4-oxalocrotonate tautomerase family)
MRKGTSVDYRRAVMTGLYDAMRETYGVPEDDRFMLLTEHDDADFWFGHEYLGIERSDRLVVIQLTVSNTRGIEQKKALFKAIVDKLSVSPGLRPEDIFINLVEVAKENWSFGNGLAQYA